MAFNLTRTAQVPLMVFGSLVTETASIDLPEGVSPDCNDIVYLPGSVGSRPALQKFFNVALPAGGPNNKIPTLVYGKSYVSPDGTIRNLYFDSNGTLSVENPISAPGVLVTLITSTPGSYCKSVTAFGREYIAISDKLHGTECALQYDGTNIDRVTQDGPGAPPTANSLTLAPTQMALTSITPLTFAVTEVDPGDFGLGGTHVNLRWWTGSSVAALSVGQMVSITGCVTTPVGGASALPLNVTNAPIIAIYTGGGGGYANLVILQVNLPANTGYCVNAGIVANLGFTGVTMTRANGIVTVNTTAPHQLVPGRQVQITNVAAGIVGTSIASVVINNEDLPGIATVTTATAHGLVPGISVSLSGIVAAAVGGAISSITRAGQIVTVTMSTAHGLSPGALITTAGVGIGSFNTTATVLNVTSPTVFTFSQVDVDASSSGGTVKINWPIPNSGTPTYFEVLTAPSSTTFQVQVNYSDGTWGAGGTVTYAWNGTFFVWATPSATQLQYKQPGPDATSASVGTVIPFGQASPGVHRCQVAFLTRQGYITKPSPVAQFTSNGGQYISVSNIPIGPPNVVARLLLFTGAGGAFYFYIPSTPQVDGQAVGTATQINDNTTTSAIIDFSDETLFASIAVSIPGNNLAAETVIDGALGFGSYAARLIAYGQRNRIQNLLNMGFEGGYNALTATTSGGLGGQWRNAGQRALRNALERRHWRFDHSADVSGFLRSADCHRGHAVPLPGMDQHRQRLADARSDDLQRLGFIHFHGYADTG